MIDGAEAMTPADTERVARAMLDVVHLTQHWPSEVRVVHQQLRREVKQQQQQSERRRETAFKKRREEQQQKAEKQQRKRQQLSKDKQRRIDQDVLRELLTAKASRQVPPVIPKAKALALLDSQISEFGPTGSSIEGSGLFRDFCCICAEAMRVIAVQPKAVCLDCQPTGCPGRRLGKSVELGENEYHGGQFNRGEW